MTKKNYALLLIPALLAFACQAPREKNGVTTSQTDSIFTAKPDFGGVVLVAYGGKPVYHKAFGYRDYAAKTAMDTASIFELASVSKTFTGILVAMLKEEGKLNYDDLLEKYIPGLPYPGITIRHLLNHTSGLPEYEKIMHDHWDKTKVAGNEEIISYLNQYHPPRLFEPGQKYSYCNTGYVLLGSIVAKTSGKDFVAFCEERIFRPLNMNSTGIRTPDEKAALNNVALGHIFVAEKGRYVRADSFPASNYVFWLGNRKGPGRVSSTTSDLLKWDQGLYSEKLLKNETKTEAFTPAKLNNDSISNYGFGWNVRKDASLGKIVWHDGDNPGYRTAIVRYIDANKTVIILSNTYDEMLFERLGAVEKWIDRNP